MRKIESKQISDLEAEVVARVFAVADQKTNAISEARREFSRRLTKAPSELVILWLSMSTNSHRVCFAK